MKKLRKILLFILGISLIIIATGFFLPAKVHVERSLVINALPEDIFEQVNTLKNWEKWSPWLQSESIDQIKYSGPESGVSSGVTWHSADSYIDNARIDVIYSVPYDSLLFMLEFGKNGTSVLKIFFTEENQITKVNYIIESDLGINPVSRWFGLLTDKMVGPDLEKSLMNLSKLMDEIKAENKFEVVHFEVPARVLLSVRDTASPSTLSSKLTSMYDRLSVFLRKRNLSPTGNPFAIYHTFSTQVFDIEACIPISQVVKTPNGLSCSKTEKQNTVMVKYYGSNYLISSAYIALQSHIRKMRLSVTGPPWEEYLSNPVIEADSNKWQTNIYFPIE
jgi:effector-binding domain-containing protein